MRPIPPKPIDELEAASRSERIQLIARRLGFRGTIEYRHEESRSGGAQYHRGPAEHEDQLVVFAAAFDRDADPADFSLGAILAHECGHQIVERCRAISAGVRRSLSAATVEILASTAGASICDEESDRESLIQKAAADMLDLGIAADEIALRVNNLAVLFGGLR